MKIKKAALSIFATSALLLGTVSPVLAADTLTISGNGEGSTNTIAATNTSSTTVSQNNDADIDNKITANANSGGNSATSNTGGNVAITTGNASTTTKVSNAANINTAHIACDVCGTGGSVTISGNGENSTNTATVGNTGSDNQVFQNNDADIDNKVHSYAKTGWNDANSNTGGNVAITTGNASTTTKVTNKANANIAKLGGSGTDNQGALSATISGNGEDSMNVISLSNLASHIISQNNDADIDNYITSSSTTGNNSAVSNTNGMVTITTGAAKTKTDVDNAVNFNAADVGCCSTGVAASILGNGEDSSNVILASLGNTLTVWQGDEESGNSAELDNKIYSDARSGNNNADGNTGWHSGGLTSVTTGSTMSNTGVSNHANANMFGSGLNLPHWPSHFPFNFSFDFDLGGLFAMLV